MFAQTKVLPPLIPRRKGFQAGKEGGGGFLGQEKNFGPLPAALRLTAECSRDIPVSTNNAERNLGLFGPSKIAKARLLRSESHAWRWLRCSMVVWHHTQKQR